ncbi:MAG: sigma-70 family RNA polymerase sigma factor [Cryomorphaceae bacterium]|nr:sigma-70 family RNA polymerase sigma factor [Cryomorphaceae bacterium]
MSTIEFNNLLSTHRDFLQGFAYNFTRDHEDANDLIQDTFLKALRYKDNFREGTNIKGWLFTIMRNIFINNYKRKKFQNTITDSTDNLYYLNASQDMRYDGVTGKIDEKDIRSAIGDLGNDFRVPFTMFIEGYHYDEISEKLSIPMGTVKSRIFHARKKLMTQLADYR